MAFRIMNFKMANVILFVFFILITASESTPINKLKYGIKRLFCNQLDRNRMDVDDCLRKLELFQGRYAQSEELDRVHLLLDRIEPIFLNTVLNALKTATIDQDQLVFTAGNVNSIFHDMIRRNGNEMSQDDKEGDRFQSSSSTAPTNLTELFGTELSSEIARKIVDAFDIFSAVNKSPTLGKLTHSEKEKVYQIINKFPAKNEHIEAIKTLEQISSIFTLNYGAELWSWPSLHWTMEVLEIVCMPSDAFRTANAMPTASNFEHENRLTKAAHILQTLACLPAISDLNHLGLSNDRIGTIVEILKLIVRYFFGHNHRHEREFLKLLTPFPPATITKQFVEQLGSLVAKQSDKYGGEGNHLYPLLSNLNFKSFVCGNFFNVTDQAVWEAFEKTFSLWKRANKLSANTCISIEKLSNDDFRRIALDTPSKQIQMKILQTLSNIQPYHSSSNVHSMLDKIWPLINPTNSSDRVEEENELEKILSLYSSIFKHYADKTLPDSIFRLLLELPVDKRREKLICELSATALSENELVHLIDEVKQHQPIESSHLGESSKHNSKFVDNLCGAIQLCTKLHKLPLWNCFEVGEKEKEVLRHLFVQILPPFCELGNKDGTKAVLFEALQDIRPHKYKVFIEAYRKVITEQLDEFNRQINSANQQKSKSLPVIVAIVTKIRHHISLLNIASTLPSNDHEYQMRYKVELYEGVINLPISVCKKNMDSVIYYQQTR